MRAAEDDREVYGPCVTRLRQRLENGKLMAMTSLLVANLAAEVYRTVGVKKGEPLPMRTSIGAFALAYHDLEGGAYCARCAERHTGCYPITYVDVVYEGGLSCATCGRILRSKP